jgi:hypothetical protein
LHVGRRVRQLEPLEFPGLFDGETDEDTSALVIDVIAAWKQALRHDRFLLRMNQVFEGVHRTSNQHIDLNQPANKTGGSFGPLAASSVCAAGNRPSANLSDSLLCGGVEAVVQPDS